MSGWIQAAMQQNTRSIKITVELELKKYLVKTQIKLRMPLLEIPNINLLCAFTKGATRHENRRENKKPIK